MKRNVKKHITRHYPQNCPICNNKELLVEHHIRGRKIDNPNHLSNLAYICPNCHQKIHYGIIVLEGYFQTTNGLELLWNYYKDPSITGENIKPFVYGSTL